MNVIIPMSGIGKRFIDAGYTEPKPLIVVDGKPIIQHIIERFDTEKDCFIFICNEEHLHTTNMRKVLESSCKNHTILSIKKQKLGPVWATLQASHLIKDNEPYIVNYCDFNWHWDYANFKQTITANECDAAMVAYIGFHPHLLGENNYASMRHENQWLLEIREKYSFTPNKMDCYQSSGTYYFARGIYIKKYFQQLLDKHIDLNGEYYVSLVYNELLQDHLKIYIYPIPYFLQWGTPDDLKEYEYWSTYFYNQKKLCK